MSTNVTVAVPCICGSLLTRTSYVPNSGATWKCMNPHLDVAHGFALVCPECGPQPLDEFSVAGEVSCYATPSGYNAKGELDTEPLEPEFGAGLENTRIFHDCGAYLDNLPVIA